MISTREKILVAVVGPTAAGKTTVSIRLAQHFKTEVISADARQCYREMNIGTAKPSGEELQRIPHHFINSLSIHDLYTAGNFEHDALALLNSGFKKQDVMILCGGSGLFVKAVLQGFDSFPPEDESVKSQLAHLYEQEGIGALQKILQEKDPAYYARVDLNNPRRILRALTVTISSGKPYSAFRKQNPAPRKFKVVKIGLNMDRKLLNDAIDARVDAMINQGLMEEARALWPYSALPALQTVGYSELFDHLEGKMSLEQAIALIKQNTRNYAKRQMTWFRKEKDIHWFEPSQVEEMILLIEQQR